MGAGAGGDVVAGVVGVAGATGFALDLLLIGAGIITATALVWFTNAAKRLRLTTIGLMQYIAPTGHFLLAVLAFREPLRSTDLFSFVLIWIALVVFTVDSARAHRGQAGGASVAR